MTKPDLDGIERDRTDAIRRMVEEMLTIGVLKPGQRLNELALASQLGVGRAAVRETVRALEYDGLVISRVNQGAFVSVINLDDALEIYDTNAILFGYAAHQLAGRASSTQCLALTGFIAMMDEAIKLEDTARYAVLNAQFHKRIFGFANNSHASRIYGVATKRLTLLRRRTFETTSNMINSNDEHRLIVDAIVTKKPDLARRLAEDHGLNGRKRFLLANADAGVAEPAAK